MKLKQILFSIMMLSLWLASAGMASADSVALQDALRKLETLDRVEGSAVYYSGVKGEFFKLYEIIKAEGNAATIAGLLKSAHSVERAMGLLTLANNEYANAVPALKRSLLDRGSFTYFPGGCMGWGSTVGNFARELLHDVHHLGTGPRERPLLSDSELMALDIDLISRDESTPLHDAAGMAIENAVAEGKLKLELALLKQGAPTLPDYRIVKAIGRIEPSAATRHFLMAVLADTSLEDNARLAAASGLTRDPHPEVLKALQAQRKFLDGLEDRPLGSSLLSTLEKHTRHKELMDTIHAEKTWKGMEKIKDTVIEALSTPQPFALAYQQSAFGLALVRDHKDVKRALVEGLVGTAATLSDTVDSWNTYSNTADAMEWMLMKHDDYSNGLSEADSARLAKLLAAHRQ